MALAELVRKYSTQGPRYTSYPTANLFSSDLTLEEYRRVLERSGGSSEPISLYVHLPFCESLCHYCGCNIQITKNHDRTASYVTALDREAGSIAAFLNRRPISQMSWGGGTPTFLSPRELEKVFSSIDRRFSFVDGAEVSIEIDPRVTSREQLAVLRHLGFNRVSLGVQDFEPSVQKAVHRIQSIESTESLMQYARELGFSGINVDLIYGLPLQTVASFEKTVERLLTLSPDRIALYNYAHVPSLRPHQKLMERHAMPTGEERLDIFLMAFEHFTQSGYSAIGMDHFAKQGDELSLAYDSGRLYRNFMGYTVKRGTDLVGLGASAIGDFEDGYFQNLREPDAYESAIADEGFATFRGVLLSEDDRRRKWVIQSLMCRFALDGKGFEERFGEEFDAFFSSELGDLSGFFADGFLQQKADHIEVTPLGRLFIRNVAMKFDAYLSKASPAQFSKTL